MHCEICKKTIPEVELYRQNEKGVTGIWRCFEHNKAVIDSEVLELVKIISKENT